MDIQLVVLKDGLKVVLMVGMVEMKVGQMGG